MKLQSQNEMKGKLLLCGLVLIGVLFSGTPSSAYYCRNYIDQLEFWFGQGPDNDGRCRMDRYGEYPPESVPYRLRDGIEQCYRKRNVQAEYAWKQGRRIKGTLYLSDESRAEVAYRDSFIVQGPVKVIRDGKLLCEIPVVDGLFTGVIREFYPDGRLAEGFRLKRGKLDKGMVAFTPGGVLKKFECAERPIFPGDEERCGFSGKPSTITLVSDFDSTKTTVTHLNGYLVEKTDIHSNGYKYIRKYPNPGKDLVHAEDYSPNGKLKAAYMKEEGQLEGEAKDYYKDGQISRIAIFQKGIAREIKLYYMNGQPKLHASLTPDTSLCTVTHYYQDGKPETEGTYKTARSGQVEWRIPHGSMRTYNKDGTVRSEGPFINGEREGIHTVYLESGVKLEVKYEKGSPVTFRKFDRSGNFVSQGNIYEDGSVKEALRNFDRI